MLTFGKKVDYRPWILSIFFGVLVGAVVSALSWKISVLVGIIVFLISFFLYYYMATAVFLYDYWEVGQNYIRYNDIINPQRRLLSLLFPNLVPLKSVKKSDVVSITTDGDYGKLWQPPFMIFYAPIYAAETPIMTRVHTPVGLTLNMKDGQKINLTVSRDYAYNTEKTIKMVDQFLGEFQPSQIKIGEAASHTLKLN